MKAERKQHQYEILIQISEEVGSGVEKILNVLRVCQLLVAIQRPPKLLHIHSYT